MDELKQITLKELIETTKKFVNGEITLEEFADFGSKMNVRGYIPIREKVILIMNVLNDYLYSSDYTQELIMAQLYSNIFFKILLQGYALILCNDATELNFDNYDLLEPFFQPFILSYCKDDYDNTIGMLKDSINMYNINNLIEGFNSIDIDKINEYQRSNENLITKLNSNADLIKDLKEIALINDPTVASIVSKLQEEVREKTI